MVADLGQACWSLGALRRACGHEALRLSAPVSVVPPAPGSRVAAPAVPPAGGQQAQPAPEPRSVLVRPSRIRITKPSEAGSAAPGRALLGAFDHHHSELSCGDGEGLGPPGAEADTRPVIDLLLPTLSLVASVCSRVIRIARS